MSIHFDAQFYMGPGKDPLVASLQYFNAHHLAFEDGGQYFLWANVSHATCTIHVTYTDRNLLLDHKGPVHYNYPVPSVE